MKALILILTFFSFKTFGQTPDDCTNYWFMNKSGILIQKVFDKYVELPPIDSFYCMMDEKDFEVNQFLNYYNKQFDNKIGKPGQVSSRAFYYRLKGDSVFQNVHIATFFYYPGKSNVVKKYFRDKLNKVGTFKSKVLERYRILFKDSMIIIISSFSYNSLKDNRSLFNVYYNEIKEKLATE